MLAVRTVHSSDQRWAFVIFDISIGDLLPAVSLRCRMCALWVWGGDSDFLFLRYSRTSSIAFTVHSKRNLFLGFQEKCFLRVQLKIHESPAGIQLGDISTWEGAEQFVLVTGESFGCYKVEHDL